MGRSKSIEGALATGYPADTTVLVKDVHAILMLASVRGDYEEYFSQEDSKVITEMLGKLGFKKKAMLRVRGKVTVGYQFEEADIVPDAEEHRLIITTTKDPGILAIEHDVDYVDLDQGILNHFKAEDLTAINAQGKQRIREKALAGDLFSLAHAKRTEVLGVINNYVKAQGWDLVVDSSRQAAALIYRSK
ncbi:MAG: DUF4230 domain-containing protein [Flavobacteriales bacterium]|nr:DUF4230 domain-containing protein [Flavobacteriales bacterium]